MSQHFSKKNGDTQYSPPNNLNTGVEGLMSSLISPGPGTPIQAPFQMPWMGLQNWSAPGASSQNMQNRSYKGNNTSFLQNNEEEYVPYSPSEDQYGRPSFNVVAQDAASHSGGASTLISPQSPISSSPVVQTSQAQSTATADITARATPSASATDAAENAKRLKELRAQLMAKKPKESREPTPALRSQNPIGSTPSKPQPTSQLTNNPDVAQAGVSNGTISGTQPAKPGSSAKQLHASSGGGIGTDLDNLFAEVRKESKEAGPVRSANDTKPNGTTDACGLQASTTNATNGHGASTSPSQIKELNKDLNAIRKKLKSSQKTSSIVAQNPGLTLDQLVAAKKINVEQKASVQKRPTLQNQLAQAEKALSHAQQHNSKSQRSAVESAANGNAKNAAVLHPIENTEPDTKTEQSKRVSSADLSDGEIRSDDGAALAPAPNSTPKKPPPSKETSLDAEEKSRRESEVEATYQPPAATSRESQEKLRRQSQVSQAYSPLNKNSGSVPKPQAPPLDTATPRKASGSIQQSPKSAVEQPSRPWITQTKDRINDRYVPSHRKVSLNDSVPSPLGKKSAAGEGIDVDERRRLEQNERAAAEYKKALDARPEPPSRVISHTDTTYLGRIGDDKPEPRRQEPDPASTTQASSTDSDVKDWLELTEYYDENYRKGRLNRFRKKKQLEFERLQIEQEEQLEQQQRALFRSALPDVTPQKPQMPPPNLPLRENKPPNQVAQPTLKRQHAEDDTDARPKFARIDPSHSSIKDETSPSYLPLEQRISRDDNWHSRYRPRSRSPDRYRRRSASPERRRFSVPEHSAFVPTCHNCDQVGHYKNQCNEPFRDGRDRFRQPPPKQGAPYHRFNEVSPNYQGKNPLKGFRDPRAGRNSSIGRSAQGEDDRRP